MSKGAVPSHLASEPQEYERLGLKKERIEQWEDGLRTTGEKGSYEWWYFDAHLHDGSKLVITYETKNFSDVDKPLMPIVVLNLDRADGTAIAKTYNARAQDFVASKENCDLRIGRNTFSGDLHTYKIHVEIDDVLCDVTITGTVPAWRPETGYLYFGEHDQHYFAWLSAVPQGDVEVDIVTGNTSEHYTGTGYHDHNWGNVSMLKLMNNWYWARGTIGDYTVIASYITAEKQYGYKKLPVFMLCYNGKVIADDGTHVHFSAADIHPDNETAKPVANLTSYEYKDDSRHYLLTFKREKTILRLKFIDSVHGLKHLLARLIGFDGAYLRFTGKVELQRFQADGAIETQDAEAIWELMYFGHVPKT